MLRKEKKLQLQFHEVTNDLFVETHYTRVDINKVGVYNVARIDVMERENFRVISLLNEKGFTIANVVVMAWEGLEVKYDPDFPNTLNFKVVEWERESTSFEDEEEVIYDGEEEEFDTEAYLINSYEELKQMKTM